MSKPKKTGCPTNVPAPPRRPPPLVLGAVRPPVGVGAFTDQGSRIGEVGSGSRIKKAEIKGFSFIIEKVFLIIRKS